MVIALNQVDMAKKKGIEINYKKLEKTLGVPVIPTVAIRGTGVYELLQRCVETIEKGGEKPSRMKYGEEIEKRIKGLSEIVKKVHYPYPARWTAIKLLEKDEQPALPSRGGSRLILRKSFRRPLETGPEVVSPFRGRRGYSLFQVSHDDAELAEHRGGGEIRVPQTSPGPRPADLQ